MNITQKGISSIIDFYDILSIDKYETDEAQAFVTGIDSPFLNALFDCRLERKKVEN